MDPEVDHMGEAYNNWPRSTTFCHRTVTSRAIPGLRRHRQAEKQTPGELKDVLLPELRGMGWGKRPAGHCLNTPVNQVIANVTFETVDRMYGG